MSTWGEFGGGLVQVLAETSYSETSDNEIGASETGDERASEGTISLKILDFLQLQH